MPSEDAIAVIFFVLSLYCFGAALVYALARAWARALSTRPQHARSARPGPSNSRHFMNMERRGSDFRPGK